MQFLTDRKKIAQAMNFGKYPVVRIDLETPKAGWDDCFEGDRIMVALPDDKDRADHIRCTLHKFGDTPNRYTLMPEATFLDSSFGYSDVMEMLAWSKATVIHPGDTVVVIEDYPKARTCRVHLMKVSRCSGRFVYPTCYLDELEERE